MSHPYHASLLIAGKVHPLSHLDPFQMIVDSNKAGKSLRLHVRFTAHCFSKKYDAADHPADEPVVHDAAGRPRSFCPVRYRISGRLPGMIRALNHPKAAVTQTAKERNWLHSMTIDEPHGKYHIFFELRRAAKGSLGREDLELVVESAYHQDPSRREPAVRGAMGFILLCGKVYKGEPIATRR